MSKPSLTRRGFFKAGGAVGGGLVIGFSLSGCSAPALPIQPRHGNFIANAFLEIGADDSFVFYCPRDEMGQGVTTGLTTCLAEDFDVDPARFDVKFSGVHPDYNNGGFMVQMTGSSTSMPSHYAQLRQVGADSRQLILNAAAKDLGVPIEKLSTHNGYVVTEDERLPYSRFLATAILLPMPSDSPLQAPSEFRFIGKNAPRLDGLSKSTGTAVFAVDIDISGMHYAVVVRAPVAGGKLESVDTTTARNYAGVTDIVEISSGIAVVAQTYWQAKKAAMGLSPKWTTSTLAALSTQQQQAEFLAILDSDEGDSAADGGDLSIGFGAAVNTLDRDYWTPYLSHSPMEPMSAVVRIGHNEAEIWAGTQAPGIARSLVAKTIGIDADNIVMHTTYLGGAFGRRAFMDFVVETAEVAKVTNKPIKLLWSREDDIKQGPFRPSSLVRIKAGIDEAGRITAWQAKRVGGNIAPNMMQAMLPALMPNSVAGFVKNAVEVAVDGWFVDPTSVEGLHEDYAFENFEVTHATVDHGVPLAFWRSVGHSFTAFSKETAIDELAGLASQEPVAFRLLNLPVDSRLRAPLEAVAKAAAGRELPIGHAWGFASHSSFGSFVAEAAEVSIDQGKIKVHNVICAVDCGIAVTPDIVRAQMEGAIAYGLSAALHGNLELEQGAIAQSNFHDYPVLRMNEAPAIEVIIIDSLEDPMGVGEPGLPPIAPAVANAVAQLSGQRLTSLPLKLV